MASLFEGLFSGGAILALERGLQFSSARHRLILENIANADTPGYRRKDLDVGSFEAAMKEAAAKGSWEGKGLEPRMLRDGEGSAEKVGGIRREGLLRHDRNNVDMEMELALLRKNGSYFNQMASLLRKSFEGIRLAIAERATG